jgi:chemotaxis family two-component system response regulator Rcp1
MFQRNVRLLIIEDSPSDIWLLREAFRLADIPIQIILARDGVQASEYFQRVRMKAVELPDLVLLDLNLPRKNGREVLAEMKAFPMLHAIPAIVLSSSSSEEDRRQAFHLNAAHFYTKPNNLPDYVELVRGIGKFWLSGLDLRETA